MLFLGIEEIRWRRERVKVELSLYIIGMILVILALIGDYVRARRLASGYQKQNSQHEIELKKAQQNEDKLREEMNILQAKLNRNLEDPVTKLSSWQLFEDRLNQNIKESARFQLTMGVLLVDIDNFKAINDGLSYEVGDAVLQEVGKRLQTCIRQVDSLSRFTKDTFGVVLTQLSKPETAVVVAQRMLQAIAQPFHINGVELYITISIGIAIYPSDGENSSTLLRSADQALHLAKEKGKNSYQFYQERMHAKSQRELALHARLGSESIFQEFNIFYQPIMNVLNDSIVCMQTLLYWELPGFGVITPQELFSFAEKQRKQNNITEWLLKHSCKEFLAWRQHGFYPEMLSIPISLKQLENSHFIYRISQILQELQFNPECLLLEIKDTSVQPSFDVLEKAFNMLNYLKVKIAIDNFGAGSFSLLYLKNLHANFLKLDRALIDDVTTNAQTEAMLKPILLLAKNLNMQIFIQGVTTKEQVTKLKELGCIFMEGSFLNTAIAEQEVIEKLVVPTH